MADTLYKGLIVPVTDIIPDAPQEGFIRIYTLSDGSIWMVNSQGVRTRITNG